MRVKGLTGRWYTIGLVGVKGYRIRVRDGGPSLGQGFTECTTGPDIHRTRTYGLQSGRSSKINVSSPIISIPFEVRVLQSDWVVPNVSKVR